MYFYFCQFTSNDGRTQWSAMLTFMVINAISLAWLFYLYLNFIHSSYLDKYEPDKYQSLQMQSKNKINPAFEGFQPREKMEP